MTGREPRLQGQDFPRLHAPLVCRPRGLPLFHERAPRDVRLGGARVFSDERYEVGAHLDVEIFLPEGGTLSAGVEVAFVEELPQGAPARFDVGLRFLELRHEDRARLQRVLD